MIPHEVETRGRQVLAGLGHKYGLNMDGAEVLLSGTNAVFALPGVPLIAKVYPPEADPVRLSTEAAFAKALADAGVPIVRPATAYGPMPLGEPGGWVTMWRRVEEDPAARLSFSGRDLGLLLRQFVEVSETVRLGVPLRRQETLKDTGKALASMAMASMTTEEERALLLSWHSYIVTTLIDSPPQLGYGTLHGDLCPLNLIWSAQGPVLCDTDALSAGPLEWDLVPWAVHHDTGRWPASEYEAFCQAWGADVREWAGYPAFVRARGLERLVWALRYRGGNAEASAWLEWFATGAKVEESPF